MVDEFEDLELNHLFPTPVVKIMFYVEEKSALFKNIIILFYKT